MTNMTNTERSGVVESWDPNPKPKPGQRKSLLPRKLLRGCLRKNFLYLVALRLLFSVFLMLLSFTWYLFKNICFSHQLEYFVKISSATVPVFAPNIILILVVNFFTVLNERTACGCCCIQFLIFFIFIIYASDYTFNGMR